MDLFCLLALASLILVLKVLLDGIGCQTVSVVQDQVVVMKIGTRGGAWLKKQSACRIGKFYYPKRQFWRPLTPLDS